MAVITEKLAFKTEGNCDVINVTNKIDEKVQECSINSGIVCVFVPGATGSVTTIEYEPGLVADIKDFFEKTIPQKIQYKHNLSHADENGHSHIRASLVGPSLTIPFSDKKMLLGRWQQIIFIDFDNRPRDRELIIQIIGE